MLAVDNTFLTLMLHPSAKPPLDPSTGRPVDRLEERIELLIDTLSEDRETLIIPTPVLSEFLILAGKDGPKYLTLIGKNSIFKIEDFDTRAAVELAAIELDIRSKGSKRADQEGTWAKIKFDRQIVTIAKVNGATKIYSDDEDVERFARRCGIPVVKTWELPLPQGTQDAFDFTEPERAFDYSDFVVGQLAAGESQHEEANNGTEEAGRTAITGVPDFPRLGPASGVSAEEGSGAEGSEAREEQ